MHKKYLYKYLLIAAFIVGCNSVPNQLEAVEYISWYQKNIIHFKGEQQFGEYIYSAQYIPSEVQLASLIVKDGKSASLNNEDNYFTVLFELQNQKKSDILKNNLQQDQIYFERLSYFTNDAYKDAFMVFDKDTLYCQMHHFERTYKLNPGVVVSFIFDNYKNQSTPGYFVFNDQIFGNGPVRINFDKEYMSKIPKLKNI